jgi:hypothetical protein
LKTMPLHDWAALLGWNGVHQVWIVELLYWIKPRLPAGYRAYIGTTPTFAIGVPGQDRPDVGTLPAIRLPLSVQESVVVDLEQNYARAAAAVYLS